MVVITFKTRGVYFWHQNQNAKNIDNFKTLLKPHNVGTRLKCIETSFQVVPLFLTSFRFWVISSFESLQLHCMRQSPIHELTAPNAA
jgi:hypothetical protein